MYMCSINSRDVASCGIKATVVSAITLLLLGGLQETQAVSIKLVVMPSKTVMSNADKMRRPFPSKISKPVPSKGNALKMDTLRGCAAATAATAVMSTAATIKNLFLSVDSFLLSSVDSFLLGGASESSSKKGVAIGEPVPAPAETEPELPLGHEFLCPITFKIMKDPVTTANGHTYERSAIEQWLAIHDREPMTNAILTTKYLTPNRDLLNQIISYFEALGGEKNEVEAEMRRKNDVEAIATGTPQVSSPVVPTGTRVLGHKFRHFDAIADIGKNYDKYDVPILFDRSESDREIIGVEHQTKKDVFEILITNRTGEQRVRTFTAIEGTDFDPEGTYLILGEKFDHLMEKDIVKISSQHISNDPLIELRTGEQNETKIHVNHGEVMFGGIKYDQFVEGICFDKVDKRGDIVMPRKTICKDLDYLMEITEVVKKNAENGDWNTQPDESLWEYFTRKPKVTTAVLNDLNSKVSSLEQWSRNGEVKKVTPGAMESLLREVMLVTPEKRELLKSGFEEAIQFLRKALMESAGFDGFS